MFDGRKVGELCQDVVQIELLGHVGIGSCRPRDAVQGFGVGEDDRKFLPPSLDHVVVSQLEVAALGGRAVNILPVVIDVGLGRTDPVFHLAQEVDVGHDLALVVHLDDVGFIRRPVEAVTIAKVVHPRRAHRLGDVAGRINRGRDHPVGIEIRRALVREHGVRQLAGRVAVDDHLS